MKIARIEVYQVDLPYAGGVYRLSGGRDYTSFDATIVAITTDCGLTGWGESTPFGSTYTASHAGGVRAGIDLIAPRLLGADPRLNERIYDEMNLALMGHGDAKCALDIACWDIAGQAAGLPVCDMLGGRVAGTIPMISSIGSDTPNLMRANVAHHRALGFRGHSVKVGAAQADGGPSLDAERVMACLADREAGEWFLADANGGMTPEHALRFLALLPDGLDFVLEAPCASWRETLSLRSRCNRPVLLDELVLTDSDLIHAIHTDACDGVGLKISKQGGLTPARRQRDIALASGLVISVQDTVGSEIAFAGVLHMAQSVPRHALRCALDTRAMVNLKTAAFDAPIINGGAVAPDVPGLGVAPDMDVLGAPVAVYDSLS